MVQRLKALQQAAKDGNWHTASKMLVDFEDSASITGIDELLAAQKAQLLEGKILQNQEKMSAR